jgi:hypothetical protein
VQQTAGRAVAAGDGASVHYRILEPNRCRFIRTNRFDALAARVERVVASLPDERLGGRRDRRGAGAR